VLLDESRQPLAASARQSAQAVVETALLLPMFFGLVFGTIAISRVVQAQTARPA
jgi:Flp pilus assembly protein TadG